MIQISNGVTNILGTPSMISDTLANRPDGKDVATGTIFIDINTGNIYQSNGLSWYSIGGGGTTSGIQDVLSVNQSFNTNGNTIDLNGYNFSIKDLIYPLEMQIFMSHADLFLGAPSAASFQLGLSPTNLILSKFNGIAAGIYIDYDNIFYSYGDNFYNIEFDTTNNFIETRGNNAKYGFQLVPEKVTIGDYAGTQSFPSYLQIDNGNGNFSIGAEQIILDGINLETGTSSGNSGQHLKITLNGNNYVIKLENP